MSKAVLVMDMPDKCEECPLELCIEGQFNANICRGYEKYRVNSDSKKRPDWCPLKPLPEKDELVDLKIMEENK